MSERKRKRASDAAGSRKKQVLKAPVDTIEVSLQEQEKQWAPIVASTPGISLPKSTSFEPYYTSQASSPSLLLHSESHAQIDYTAHDIPFTGSNSHLAHYVGIYDPEGGHLQLVPAREMVVRSTLKSARREQDEEDSDPEPTSYGTARRALGLAFGTKKAQKAIRNLTANAISTPNKSSDPSKPPLLDRVAQAVLSSMSTTTPATTASALLAAADAAKPRPTPNLAASSPAEVYPIPLLVGGESILPKLHVKQWHDAVNANVDIVTRSLFVSRRVYKVVQAGDVRVTRVLRYLQLLLEWSKALRTPDNSKVRGKAVPKMEDKALVPLIEDFGSELVADVKRRFADSEGCLKKWHQDNLLTHILAITLVVDGFETDTYHIQRDLGMEASAIAKYYKELGCTAEAPKKGEQEKMKISRLEAQGRRIAKLRLPLKFPQVRIRNGPPMRR